MVKLAPPSIDPFGIDAGDIVEIPFRRSRAEVIKVIDCPAVVTLLQHRSPWVWSGKAHLKKEFGVPARRALVRSFIGGDHQVFLHKLRRVGSRSEAPPLDDASQSQSDLLVQRCAEASAALAASGKVPVALTAEVLRLQEFLPDIHRPLALSNPPDPSPNLNRFMQLVEPCADPGGHFWVIDTDGKGNAVEKNGHRAGEAYAVKIHIAKAKRLIPTVMDVVPRRPNARPLTAENLIDVAATSHIVKGTVDGAIGGSYGEPPVEGALFRLGADGKEFLVRVENVAVAPNERKLAVKWRPVARRSGLEWRLVEGP